jgi:hypothetical protein
MEMSGQLHAPVAFPPGKYPPLPTEYEVWWAPELLWTLWSREIFFLPVSRLYS